VFSLKWRSRENNKLVGSGITQTGTHTHTTHTHTPHTPHTHPPHTHTPHTPHTHRHTPHHTPTHTPTYAYTHTPHTHTHAQYVKLAAFALHQLVGKHAPILRYTIFACLHVMLHIYNCNVTYIHLFILTYTEKLRIKLPFSDFHNRFFKFLIC